MVEQTYKLPNVPRMVDWVGFILFVWGYMVGCPICFIHLQ